MLVKQGLLLSDLTLTLTGFLKSVGWFAHKSMGRSAHSRERWVLQREIRLGVGEGKEWGEVAIATAPPLPLVSV
jgi:hypothetical protein